jgi:hypothetical protein
MTDRPSLPTLERLVAAHRLPEALDMALRILAAVESRAGRIDGVVTPCADPPRVRILPMLSGLSRWEPHLFF